MCKMYMVLGCGIALSFGLARAGDFSVSGYGTLSASRLSTDDAQFRNLPRQPNGANKSWDGSPDTKIGLQGVYRVNSNFSATVSALAQQQTNNHFSPRIEWAFVNYKPHADLELRVGRLGLPAFMASDYLNVNYSMTAARAPVEVYSQLPISNFNGADALWRMNVGGGNLTFQPIIGRSSIDATFSDAAATKASGDADMYGFNITDEIGNWTVRVGYIGAKVTIESGPTNQLVAGLRALGATEVANRFEYKNEKSSFSGLGLGYDDGTLLGQAEYTMRRAHGFLADTNSWYVMGGYRIGQFTPYVIGARQRVVSATQWNDVPPAMSANINGMLAAGNSSQRSLSVGARWDFAKSVAAKIQFSRITPENGSAAGLLMYDANKGPLAAQNLMTVSLDSVF